MLTRNRQSTNDVLNTVLLRIRIHAQFRKLLHRQFASLNHFPKPQPERFGFASPTELVLLSAKANQQPDT
jgi:hypothetical protein